MNYKNRIKKLRTIFEKAGCDGFIVDNPLNIFYLTGQQLSTGTLLITKKSCRLIIDSRYYESCKNVCPFPVLLQAGDPLSQILEVKGFCEITHLGFDSQNTSYDKYLSYKAILKKKSIKFIGIKNPVLELRSIKEPEEIELLEKAANLGSEGFDYVCSILKPGITEEEVARELEIFWKRRGSRGLAFESIIAFGKNSSMPHYRPKNVPLKKGDPVLVDIGVNLNHYHSDMTRVPFFGKPSKKMQEIYAIVLEAQLEALALCKPGARIADIDAKSREVMERYGYAKYFTHGLGHGVGLEIHELPVVKTKNPVILQEGMIITIEPGLYLAGEGGVRIEDTIVLTKKGYSILTKVPKDLLILS